MLDFIYHITAKLSWNHFWKHKDFDIYTWCLYGFKFIMIPNIWYSGGLLILIHDSITLPGMIFRKSMLMINRGVNEQFGEHTLVHPALVLCYICLVLYFRACLFIVALWSPAGKGLSSWLSFAMSNCELVTFPLVSWVRCGTWLYWFLIFVLFLTLARISRTLSDQNWAD